MEIKSKAKKILSFLVLNLIHQNINYHKNNMFFEFDSFLNSQAHQGLLFLHLAHNPLLQTIFEIK
ncbi:hypothetical protein BpHYR1_004262 [Brachionus plicatilis]|uniref:Uncharacterized protein n=1 Tax=Brachionus plicatilis TaxID=10195 RepID=A0A3M7RTC5_BRAPC|nr:hypothetical protein BpHYR1_004262 [Brachionus plicatilis]